MDEFQKKLLKALDEIDRSLCAIGFMLFMLTFIVCFSANAQSYSEVVSFNDAEQLAAISDSIVGVCDTVKTPFKGTQYHYGSFSSMEPCSTTQYEGDYITITCRELVCVAADWPKMEWKWVRREGNYPKIYLEWKEIDIPMEWREIFIPGTAIITWREVKP